MFRCSRSGVLLLLAIAAWLLPVARVPAFPSPMYAEEMDTPLYDYAVDLLPAVSLAADSPYILYLESQKTDCLRLMLTRKQLLFERDADGKAEVLYKAPSAVTPGTPYHLVIMRRGEWLGLQAGGTLVYRGQVKRIGKGAAVSAGKGWEVTEARVQRLEPVVFADNFMRTAEESGGWEARSGNWRLLSAWDRDPKGNAQRFNNAIFALNPFAWTGANPNGAALCTAGKPFWEDYTFSFSACPGRQGAVGLMVNVADAQHGLLVRWSPANAADPTGNRLVLFAVDGEKRTKLAEDAGGYVPGQWYRLAVTTSLDGVRVSVDGRERLAARDVTPWRGGIGLYAEGAEGAVFDDVTVYGRTLGKDLLAENALAQLNERFQTDDKGMETWSNARSDWLPLPGAPGARVHRLDFYGDHWMSLVLRPTADAAGRLWLALQGDGQSPTSGFRAEIQLSPEHTAICRLYRNDVRLAEKTAVTLTADEDYAIRFRRSGDRLQLEIDGEPVLETVIKQSLSGTHPAFGAEGALARTRDMLVLGPRLLDYVFTEAPVDWRTHGSWQPTVRWACSPQWSFLGGWNRGEAALWHKDRFTGDQTLEAFTGFLMEYPREHDTYHERYRDVAVTICGDGNDPRSGYAGIYGADDEGGAHNRRTVLLRNGEVVGTANLTIPGFDPLTHRHWYELALRKRGNVVEFWVEGKPVLTYTDPKPLDGGIPAVWTTDNGIAVARVRLSFANPAQPRTDPLVAIDTPWYPEWANAGSPLTLNFPDTLSSSGRDVRIQAVACQVPSGQEGALKVNGRQAVFTPEVAGAHWYRLFASEEGGRSPDFHFTLPVFTPKLGRDDTHALVLYRFDEGKGTTVQDHGAAPPLELRIPADAEWLPGQGLSVVPASSPLMTPKPANKLLALAKTQAFTLEFWVSTASIYPVDARACLLAWEAEPLQGNFAAGHCESSLMLTPRRVAFLGITNAYATVAPFRTGLHHLAFTWDGTTTTGYVDGTRRMSKRIYLNPARWQPDLPLLLGGRADGRDKYLGTFYLVAIHDRCFTLEEVKRHYEAGPSAR